MAYPFKPQPLKNVPNHDMVTLQLESDVRDLKNELKDEKTQAGENFDENLKRHTMAFASVIGGLGLLTANPEYVQHIFDGFSDSYDFWRRAPREEEQRL